MFTHADSGGNRSELFSSGHPGLSQPFMRRLFQHVVTSISLSASPGASTTGTGRSKKAGQRNTGDAMGQP
jgi:hypothetical protein